MICCMRIKMDLQIVEGQFVKKMYVMKNHIGKEHDRQTKNDTF